MSKQIFIPTAGLAADTTQISALADGEAGFFKAGSTAAIADLDTLSKREVFQIIAKRADGTLAASAGFTLDDIIKVEKIAPSNGTVQSTEIVPVLPATQAPGDEYIVRIIETTKGNRTNARKSFSVFRGANDFTVATLIDALVAKIGTNMNVHVTAVDGTTKLVLNGTDPEKHFRVAVDGKLAYSVISYPTPNSPSNGKAAQIAALEADCESFSDGISNKVGFPVNRPASQVTGDDYTLYVITMDKKGKNIDSANPVKYDDLTIYIAETTGEVGEEIYKTFNGIEDVPEADV